MFLVRDEVEVCTGEIRECWRCCWRDKTFWWIPGNRLTPWPFLRFLGFPDDEFGCMLPIGRSPHIKKDP